MFDVYSIRGDWTKPVYHLASYGETQYDLINANISYNRKTEEYGKQMRFYRKLGHLPNSEDVDIFWLKLKFPPGSKNQCRAMTEQGTRCSLEATENVFCDKHAWQGRKCKPDNEKEAICRDVFHKTLPGYHPCRLRPPFLRNPKTKNCLELDFFCADLQLAIEYNGPHHYIKGLHDTEEKFQKRKLYDQMKVEQCKAHSIHL